MQALRILGIMAAFCSASNGVAQLNDGDTIVFFGDSITQQGAASDGYVSLFRRAIERSRPDSRIRVIGAGISGNKVPNLEERLERDVLAHKPNVVVIYIGINDVWHSIRGQGTEVDRFESGLKNLVARCTKAEARVVLATPGVIGELTDGSNDLDQMLDQYSGVSRSVAAGAQITLLDLRTSFLDYLKSYNVAGQAQGILTTDGVHLNPQGNQFVAARMLEAVGERPSPKKLLRHVVLFKYKPEVTAQQIDEINTAFHQLQYQIPEIRDFERGINNSPEGLDKGFTHGYTVTFHSVEDRAIYLPHPEHQKFVQLIGGKIDDVLVFDYWTVQ